MGSCLLESDAEIGTLRGGLECVIALEQRSAANALTWCLVLLELFFRIVVTSCQQSSDLGLDVLCRRRNDDENKRMHVGFLCFDRCSWVQDTTQHKRPNGSPITRAAPLDRESC